MNCCDYNELPLVLDVIQLSKVLGIGRNSAYELIRSERIRSLRIGNRIRITKAALREYLEQ